MNATQYPNVTTFAVYYRASVDLLMDALANASLEVFKEALAKAYLAESFSYQAQFSAEQALAHDLVASIKRAIRIEFPAAQV